LNDTHTLIPKWLQH